MRVCDHAEFSAITTGCHDRPICRVLVNFRTEREQVEDTSCVAVQIIHQEDDLTVFEEGKRVIGWCGPLPIRLHHVVARQLADRFVEGPGFPCQGLAYQDEPSAP